MIKKGLFITFEGIDGSGKTTQMKKFSEFLFDLDKHNHVISTRNPYKDTNIRAILREENDPMTQSDRLADLFIEDRKKQCEEIIVPNLEKGFYVVQNSFIILLLHFFSFCSRQLGIRHPFPLDELIGILPIDIVS